MDGLAVCTSGELGVPSKVLNGRSLKNAEHITLPTPYLGDSPIGNRTLLTSVLTQVELTSG